MKRPTFKLDVFDSMHNRHINRAGYYAKIAFIQYYGEAMWELHMLEHERSNMVTLFQAQATEFNGFYALAVMAIVNGEWRIV